MRDPGDRHGDAELLSTLNQIAEVLQEEAEPALSVSRLAFIVRDHIAAHHVKVLVVQRGKGLLGLEQICRTDEEMAHFDRRLDPITEDQGLANWVVLNDDWLAVPEVPKEWPRENALFPTITGRHSELRLKAMYERDSVASDLDHEATMLMVPLRAGGRAAGVLGVWRDRPRPGSGVTSPQPFRSQQAEALLQVAPFVAASCQQVLQRRVLEDELKSVSELADDLHEAKSLGEAYKAVAHRVGELSEAMHTLLLHHDPDRPGHLYHRATWSANGEAPEVAECFRGFHIVFSKEDVSWRQRILEKVEECLADLSVHRLTGLESRIHGPTTDQPPDVVAVLLDRATGQKLHNFFADDLLAHSARSFLRYAHSMLGNHIQTYAQRLVDALGRTEGAESWRPLQVLSQAAGMLRSVTGASGALVYSGPGEELAVTGSSPEHKAIHGWGVTPHSLTKMSVLSKRPERVVDIGDESDMKAREMDHKRLNDIRAEFGWRHLRSWLVCPVLDRGRCVGVLKLLTADRDVFLGKDHEELAKTVADRVAWEIRKLNRRLLLEELNLLANELTQTRGQALGKKIVVKLGEWAARFLQPGSKVAIFTRTPPDHALIDHASEGLGAKLAEDLRSLSRQLKWEERVWKSGETVETPTGRFHLTQAGVAIPIPLPDKSSIQGHLMVLHKSPFSAEEQDAAREAAREVGLVLHSERLTRHWKEQAGRFRHAVIGPVQGLRSAALELVEIVKETPADLTVAVEVDEISRQIREEAELVRIWRYNQRLYAQESVEVKTRNQPLKRVFERCLKRYQPIVEGRGILIVSSWRPYGQVRFPFDEEGIDLVLSNLLDNAAKYAFRETDIEVGVQVEDHWACLWVENVGHRIPERLDEEIYKVAKRLDWDDPFRTIEGQGLGLPMTKAIVDAHGGKIHHTSKLWIKGRSKETEPYKVRFTVELPISFQV